MTVYAVAMAEVQQDSDLAEADVADDWDTAVDIADSFMKRCVSDFYGIDPADSKARRAKLEQHVVREFSVWHGKQKLEISFDDPDGMLALVACVQEVELR